MARIRTIKPEFWDSPSTAAASPWARLAYIAMWNWADDYGRGTANLKELEGFIFPNDTFPQQWSGNTVTFRSVVAEVSACFGVLFYEVEGRPYFAIPSWEKHQRNEKRAAQSRYPAPSDNRAVTTADNAGAETPQQASVNPRISALGTGEQGNRGAGEQGNIEPAAERGARARKLPADWTPKPETVATIRAELPNLDLTAEHRKFADHFTANGKPMKDWDAAWRNWMRRATQYAPRPTRQDERQAMFDRWDARAAIADGRDPFTPTPTVIEGAIA